MNRILIGMQVFVCLALAPWILWSGFAKFADLDFFLRTLEAHSLLNYNVAQWMSVGVPIVEVCVGCSIIVALLERKMQVGLMLLALLFAAFTIYATLLTLKPPPSPASCGCGPSREIIASWSGIAMRGGLICGVCAILAGFSTSKHTVTLEDTARSAA